MNSFLLDMNVVSELRKESRCDPNVRGWVDQTPAAQIYLSVLSLAEIRKGIARIQRRDPIQADHLESWRVELEREYGDRARLLPVDAAIARTWGDFQAIRPVATMDCLIAATAAAYDLVLVTRNVADFSDLPLSLIDPFESRKS